LLLRPEEEALQAQREQLLEQLLARQELGEILAGHRRARQLQGLLASLDKKTQ
jgi:hypothetical protein